MTPNLPPARVLLVDDEAPLLAALSEALRGAGFEVTACPGPAAALDALRGARFDLLLSDLAMPGGDGLQLLRRVRRADPELVAVIMTGGGSIPEAVEAMRLGAFDVVEKPLRWPQLRSLLDRALEARRSRAEHAVGG